MVVHVRKLFKKKKNMKNQKNRFFFFLQSRGEENNIRRAHTSTQFKKYIGVCFTFIVLMINLANLEINYQCLSLSLSLTY